jgi:peptidoglycan/xylan/chitin deacetylase (PgdA/CDA1 family)
VNRTLKHAGLRALRSAGGFSIASRLRRRDTLLILCYHGISLDDEHVWEGGLYLPPDTFRRRLQLLGQLKANVLPLAEGLARLKAGTLPPRSVVLTFDDGFHDFYRHALPALRDFGFPCTLYLTTYYCDRGLPIFNLIVNYMLWKGGPPGTAAGENRLREVARITEQADRENWDARSKNEFARNLAQSFGLSYEDVQQSRLLQIMSPEEVSEAARHGVDVELHTHRHRTPDNRELFLREIRDNSRRIQELTGRAPVHFCYPSGVTSPEFLPWLREAGVKSATTCEPGLASQLSDPLMLPRFSDGTGVAEIDFESWLSGVR